MSVRGAFDVRLQIEAEDELAAWQLATQFMRDAKSVAPAGVRVAYVQLRPPHPSAKFEATMGVRKHRRRARGAS